MAEWEEIARVEDLPIPGQRFAYESTCDVCGRGYILHYNGGELDHHECCGRRYELEAPQIDFVVSVSRGEA